jgi:hypothetical protein
MTYLSQNQIKEFREANKPVSCPILDTKTNDWVLDHDHQTGMVRGVLSRQANSLLGKVENFFLKMCRGRKEDLPNTLEAMAAYLDREEMDVLHPVGLTQLTRKFANSLTASQQVTELKDLGASEGDLASCKNQKQRKELFRKLTKNKYE